MNILQSIVFGIIQGVTEFLPVSSSGHLLVARIVFGIQEMPILFEVFLHLSTLVVIIVVFRVRLREILRSLYRFLARKSEETDSENLRLFLWIIYASIVTAAIGLILSLVVEDMYVHPRIVSVLFFLTGLLLVVTYFTKGKKDYLKMKFWDAIVVGFAQGLGVLPGISRSGITISASLIREIDRRRAGEFAFLVSIPAVLGAFFLKIREAEALFEQVQPLVLLVGIVTSFVIGLVSLLLLLRVVQRGRLYLFSIYLIPMGILTFFLL